MQRDVRPKVPRDTTKLPPRVTHQDPRSREERHLRVIGNERFAGSWIEHIFRNAVFAKSRANLRLAHELDRISKRISDRAAEEAEAEKNGGKGADEDDVDINDDEALADKAWEIIRTTKRASTSWLQTKLRIGYGRATRVMDVLEERGWIGPPQTGSKTRDILRDD